MSQNQLHMFQILQNTKCKFEFRPLPLLMHSLHNLKKIDEEPKQVVSRIADKISLFERPAGKVDKQTFQTPRSADVSPARKATDRLKANFLLSDQRSRSAERYDTGRSSSASPSRERPMTIKERARNFTQASKTDNRAALPLKAGMTGMSRKPTSSVPVAASMSPKLDNQGKLDTKEQTQTHTESEITLKPDGRDTAAVGGKISISAELPKDLKTKHTVASKTADQGTKPHSVETNVAAKGPGESAEPTNDISQQSKTPSRTGARSKRRKSREPTSPISPNSENKPDCLTIKPEVTAVKPEQVDDSEAASPASDKVSLLSDKWTFHLCTVNATARYPM